MKLSSDILKVVLVSSLILILSCGKKSTGRNPYINNLPPNIGGNIEKYLSGNNACNRIPVRTFSILTQPYSGSNNTSVIQGQPQSTYINGNVSNSYVGVSAFKDVILITKITSGQAVIGFNISLYLCEWKVTNPYSGAQIDMITGYRLPVINSLLSQIIITDPKNCLMGSVDLANLRFTLPALGNVLPQYYDLSFTRPRDCFN